LWEHPGRKLAIGQTEVGLGFVWKTGFEYLAAETFDYLNANTLQQPQSSVNVSQKPYIIIQLSVLKTGSGISASMRVQQNISNIIE